MTSSLEGWPTKAKEASSPHKVRLALLDTNQVFQCIRGIYILYIIYIYYIYIYIYIYYIYIYGRIDGNIYSSIQLNRS